MSNFIGIDIGGTKMLIKSGDRVERFSTGIECSFETILTNIKEFINSDKVDGITIAVPGLVDGNRIVACDVVPGLEGIKTTDFNLDTEVTFINDVEAAMVEERHNYPDIDNLVVIMVGTGIGMSILADGRKLEGSSGFAGELGYTTVVTDEGPTYLDNVSAGAGILKKFNGSVQELKEALDSNDKRALEIIERAGRYMAMGISGVISLFNPELIVIGGGTSTYKGYMEGVKKYVEEYTLPVLMEPVKVTRSSNPGLTVVNGALKTASGI